MENEDCQPLVDGIRACFPAVTRNRISICPSVVQHNGNVQIMRVLITADGPLRTFDADGLMTLLNAHEMTAKDGQSTVNGSYAGKPCVLVLITERPSQ